MNEDIPPLHSMDSQEPHVSLSEASKGDEAPPHDTTGAAETAEITETVEITVKQPTPTAETTPVAIVVSERESAITRTSTGDTLSLESKALDIKTTEPRIPHTILLDPMVTRTTIVFPTEAVTTDRSIVMPLTPSVAATTTVLGAPSLVVSSTDRKETVPATTQTIAMAVASSPSSTSSMGSVLVSASVSASVSTSVSASVSASSSIASLSTVPVISATKVSEIVLSSTLPSFLVHLSVSAPSAPSAPSSTPLSSLSSLSSSVATPQVSSLRPSSTVNVSTPTQRPYPTAVTESQSYGIRDTPHFTVLMAIVFLLVLFHY
ncbi:hypothetical protein BDF14DRAFT_1173212 [Spinellus fusiger]|nr:hypothetical protein BDF14DRAFT_1173212 [Spinellus fusiger]